MHRGSVGKHSRDDSHQMLSENFQSPNAIPPRTSSAGMGTAINGSGTHSQSVRPVLQPLAEATWMGQSKSLHTNALPTSKSLNQMALPSVLDGTGDEPPSDIVNTIEKGSLGSTWTAEKEKIILGPYEYMLDHPGKDIRKQMIDAFNAWLSVPEESLQIITNVITMLHTASLLVDDVEDSSLLRRGVPVAHSIFGTAQTINSANYIYFHALHELRALKSQSAIDIYTEELLNLHRGQGMDLFWRDTLTCPSEDDYLEMVGNKTGGLFRLAIKLMQVESPIAQTIGRDCIPLASLLGLLFQIRDDLLNLSSPVMTHNKGLCEDLTEGKFSFPIIHAIRADQSNLQLINILKQRTSDEQVKRYAVSYMEKMGSFDYTRNVLKTLRDKAETLITELETIGGEEGKEGGRAVRGILEKMARDI